MNQLKICVKEIRNTIKRITCDENATSNVGREDDAVTRNLSSKREHR